MPELPEVETVVRGLREADVVGRRILSMRASWERSLSGLSCRSFAARIRGRRIASIDRRAKYIVVRLDPPRWLLIHLRMTGSLSVKRADEPRDAAERVAMVLDDGRELRFRDTRKFGRWTLTDDPDAILGRLGPEPLSADFSVADFYASMQAHNRMLKPLLLDQHVLAGLGNIYVDEALWEARLHPCRLSRSLTRAESRRLHGAIRTVLQRGVDGMGTTLGDGMTNFYSVAGRRGRNQDSLNVFRRHGEPCPRCGRQLERIIVGQRSTHLCTGCQRPG
jgi:formamidopyrimidine-DNA glycosylase